MWRNLVVLLVFLFTVLGPSAVIAAVGYASIRALGRNPSAANKILPAMIVAIVSAEAIAVVALLVMFQLYGRS
jgi:F0F1-type ATP synthase membrane subunit c/vacuolar-type H+-ATPase subunit K